MAAGLSSPFCPISYERPKGTLKVRGEILVERQIRQLHEVGITNIALVVGYKKEYFFYLADKYGVDIVVNREYATRNNNGSLWRVRERLDNTYVCSSDDYFTTNPFEPYVYKSYYSANYVEGPTDEWCIKVGAGDRITGATVGGEDAWGHARPRLLRPQLLRDIPRDPRTGLRQARDSLEAVGSPSTWITSSRSTW